MMVYISAITFTSSVVLLWRFALSLRPVSLVNRLVATRSAAPKQRWSSQVFSIKLRQNFKVGKKQDVVLYELPDFLDLLSVAISSGQSIYAALFQVVPRLQGVLAKELSATLRALQVGADLDSELNELASRMPQRQVVEFCHKLSIALRRGTPLAKMLSEQAESVREEVHNQRTKQAGKNETKMLIPLVFLILPVTVLFSIYPSLQLLNIS